MSNDKTSPPSAPPSDFYRIGRLPPYVFKEVNTIKAKARHDGQDIIDFGMGNPDIPPAPHIIQKLVETLSAPNAHRYSMSEGIPGLRKSVSRYYERRFDVSLDPESEIVVSIGSKEGLANLANAISKPGDTILVPNPSYPIHPYGFIIAESTVRYVPKDFGRPTEEDMLEKIKQAVEDSNPKPLAVVLNYPCNPTAETVSLEFYEEMVAFCKHHGIWIISDLAYCEIYFGETKPPSVLQVKGAKEIAIEFTSMSKTYSMPGMRVGFGSGNPTLVGALKKIKSYLDYGTFLPLQVASAAALDGPQDCVDKLRAQYKERRDVLVHGLHEAGWDVPVPDASMFIWAPLPDAWKEAGSLEFSKQLLEQAGVAVAPGAGFGEYGDGHVRISLIENTQRIRQACRNIKEFLG